MTTCYVDEDEQNHVKRAKKAIDVAMFLMFLAYTVFVVLGELRKGANNGKNFRIFVKDVGYSQIFFFLMAIAAHALAPKAITVLIIFIYLLAYAVRAVGYAINNRIILKVTW
eukprot:CAMPEP_0202959096 /NCGR_PEP_ID=MMETSP1396-20130829/3373_1 /ASSEMBLY_ACC=CAM_ASM_000872 /TAXON_ID= /ORGANISM="Pseudokeronopsis sp., Strain Brazil" /LENGTH=111 /DNA_ID=CAMNT_0049677521 /DNA_START=12 /DNA_END=344 /DNA_ORIENTATION=-